MVCGSILAPRFRFFISDFPVFHPVFGFRFFIPVFSFPAFFIPFPRFQLLIPLLGRSLSYQKHQQHLGYDNAQKHTHRIYRGIGNGRIISRNGVIGIVQRHGVRHASA